MVARPVQVFKAASERVLCEEILTEYPSTYEQPGLAYINYHNEAEVVRNGGQSSSALSRCIQQPARCVEVL
eukprot:1437411-Amphidinium_carterae.1